MMPDNQNVTHQTMTQETIFGKNVMIFDDSMNMEDIQNAIDTLHELQAHNQFGPERYALLFKPGEYELDITVDYYVQAAGLGKIPGDVVINGSVQSITTIRNNNVTTMFWRSAENFLVKPPPENPVVYWAVSQAAPYRRMQIQGNVRFDKGGWASGGVLANSIIEGQAGTPTGQQWFTRNSEIGGWAGGNWNLTFVGVEGAPTELWLERPYTVVEKTPLIREKPFLTLDHSGGYALFIPELSHETSGVSWKNGVEDGELISVSTFYIAFPDKDDAKTINAALQSGKHILFTPGIYPLDDTLRVTHPNTILFGLGMPTLIPQNGKVALSTADVDGIKIVGLVADAGPKNSPTLIEIGAPGSNRLHAENPTSLHDVYCRVGGPAVGQADTCVTINSHDVIVDHFWLWRADHGAGADWDINKSRNGLIVNGDDVIVYGLFIEHFQEYQTLWNAERGRTYFYQSETPYDPPSQDAWSNDEIRGWASYKVADHVKEHQALGLGIYSFLGIKETTDPGVRLENAIETPNTPGIVFTHIVTFAGGFGGINHTINGLGISTNVGEVRFFEQFSGK